MLQSGSLPSAIMYKFGVSSRFVTKLKSEGAALLEEAEKTAILCNQSPCVEANNRACWVKANCLPLAMSAEIRSTYGRMRNSSKDDEVRNVMEMLANLKLIRAKTILSAIPLTTR